ncbi:MAG: hypothetical protein H7Y88_08930 [Phycisphaerales bacterium]|nr:hypothetical protein [Phycisphaerales bacterium]
MKYWLTTRWPLNLDERGDTVAPGVFLQNKALRVGDLIEVGDGVLVYQFKSGPPVRRTAQDGTVTLVRRREGKQGIVARGRVSKRLLSPSARSEDYADGATRQWFQAADLDGVQGGNLVPRDVVAKVLRCGSGCNFRGLGERRSGLKEITEPQFLELERLLCGESPRP